MFKPIHFVTVFAAVLAALSGCGAVPVRSGADVQKAINPITPPQRNATDFSEALGCMDDLLLRFGVVDVTVLLEELQDKTQKLNAGTRDMLVSAVSDMTRRSRAIRLVTFGSDTNNAVNLQGQLEKRQPFAALPKYDIRGSITQFDDEVGRDQVDAGLPKITLPGNASLALSTSRARQFGAIALDLSMINTADLTLVPGVSSKNLVVLTRDLTTNQASATLQKIGIGFTFTYGRTEGPAQALRSMVELATIELFGKLLRLPYWECLRIPADNPRVQKELDDWFFAMSRNREVVGFFQEQLRNRGLYSGPADQAASPDLERAIAAFRRQVGIAPGTEIDRSTFAALVLQRTGPAPAPAPAAQPVAASVVAPVAAPVNNTAGTAVAAAQVAAAQTNATPPVPSVIPASSAATTPPTQPSEAASPAHGDVAAAARIQMSKQLYRVGDDVSFHVLATVGSYLYCYLQDSAGQVRRIFPNRFASDARVQSPLPILMPGAMRFAFQADASGPAERIGCVTTPQDVSGTLPQPLRIADFERVSAASLEDLVPLFAKAAGGNVPLTVATVEVIRSADATSGKRTE
ncbi:MAG TPA: DUF4384 domain-containing protein [Burkholderiaceae bacterium]|nr:DUF4384 domain-containing protein [Burkholderiaceae bacterium]